MTDIVSNLIKKFKKPSPPDDPIINIKPDSKNDLISSDSILLTEQVKGNVFCLKEVTIDKSADITGNIHSRSCIVNGKINGNILSVEYIEVKDTAIIEGNIKSGSIQIEAGSIINGFISIEKKIKLPSITEKISAELFEKPGNSKADLPKDAPAIADNTPAVVEDTPKIIEPEVPIFILETDKIVVETDKKPKVIQEIPLKKNDAGSSNDSWW